MARSRRRKQQKSVWPLVAIVALGAIALSGLVVLAAERSPASSAVSATPAASAAHSPAASAHTTAAAATHSTPNSGSPAPAAAHTWAGLRATAGSVWMGDQTLIFNWPGGMLARGYDSPFMKYSADGKSWASVGDAATFGNEAGLMDAIAWNGKFLVATGQITSLKSSSPTVWVSPDGHSWSQADTKGSFEPVGRIVALAANAGAIVGVTSDGQVWRSTDGRAWTHAALPGSATARIVQAVSTTKAFVIVGLNGGDGAQVPNSGVTVWSSGDGVAWKSKVLSTEQWAWGKVLVLGDRLVAYEGASQAGAAGSAAEAKHAWSSPNGFDWTAVAAPPAGFAVVASNGSLIVAQQLTTAAGAPLTLDQSIDGAHWVSLPIGDAVKGATAVTAVVPGGVFVSVAPVSARQFLEALP